MASVTLDQVTFKYPGTDDPVIVGMDLHIEDGSTHALLGASGAGKTTMLGLLSGLLQPSSGSISIHGHDVSTSGARQRNMALVFQFPVTYEAIPVLDNLTLPLTSRGWSQSDAVRRAREVADELNIGHLLTASPEKLPLFEKQLVAIGKALVRDDVDLVLLDEPLTAVEPSIKWRLRQTLNKFQANHGLTMVYVTHDQTEALTFADTVSVMADGTILQTGDPVSIYERPESRFVGQFIGSPGMQFVQCRVSAGQLTVAAETLGRVDSHDGDYLLGVRAGWCSLTPAGPWQIRERQVLGTRGGRPLYQYRLSHSDGTLLVQHAGDAGTSTSVGVSLQHFALFRGDEAVAYG